ncbi:MAG TPA: M43 family zinc metalloprotease, partial [Longimicrobiales bacterium]|nr:M43 family zinc metalloprotease [Longimicrobiales bacterium]
LNEDFRRRPGTRGHNTHPDGGDARMEFVLATTAPDGGPADGIVRIDTTVVSNPTPPGSSLFDRYAFYGYWDPERYVNVWTMPMPDDLMDTVLGMATGPETDLPGAERLLRGEPEQAEGILINAHHFGESDLPSHHNLGRTLTHEMGHYFGLLHTWGGGDCEFNDHCDDTPPVADVVRGCPDPPPPACDGRPVMVENYMNFTTDACMSTFTRDQIARMHYVLENSPRRKGLSAR